MTIDELKTIFENGRASWDGDNAFQGLTIIAKYISPAAKTILQGADHDIVYSAGAQDLLDAGLTEADAKELARLNWMVEEDDSLACFV